MFINGEYQLALTKKLSFNRLGGSAEELRAAEILRGEVEAAGGKAALEGFLMPWYTPRAQRVRITAPFEREVPATAIGFSGSTPEEGIDAPLLYAEQGAACDLREASGKIVLLNETVYDNWPRLVDSGALGYLIAAGDYDEEDARTDLAMNYLRPHQLRHGKLPGLTIRARDAIALLQDGAERVRITLLQDEFERVSHNVVAEIPGTDRAGEIVVFTAHYDSVPYSSGAWDNASGSADLMALYIWFAAHPPRRTLRFVWCGSEERGLLGSKAYVKAHGSELSAYRFCINIDMTGPALGYDRAIVTADPALVSQLEYQARELGQALYVVQDVYSSDSTPFADAGIPAVSFHRMGRAAGHSRRDLASPLSASAFARTQNLMRAFADRMINASEFPIPREIPQNMKDAIDQYYRRTASTDQKI